MPSDKPRMANSDWPWPVCHRRVGAAPVAPRMHVSLAFLEHRVHVWLPFGRPVNTVFLDRRRSVATFEPGLLCCCVRWFGGDNRPAVWTAVVLRAPTLGDAMQRLTGVTPGAQVLLRADGERAVKSVLGLIEEMQADGFDPCTTSAAYWQVVGTRLAADQALPRYSAERHAAHTACQERA